MTEEIQLTALICFAVVWLFIFIFGDEVSNKVIQFIFITIWWGSLAITIVTTLIRIWR